MTTQLENDLFVDVVSPFNRPSVLAALIFKLTSELLDEVSKLEDGVRSEKVPVGQLNPQHLPHIIKAVDDTSASMDSAQLLLRLLREHLPPEGDTPASPLGLK